MSARPRSESTPTAAESPRHTTSSRIWMRPAEASPLGRASEENVFIASSQEQSLQQASTSETHVCIRFDGPT